jgi:CBS domain-containing protein
MGKVKNILDRKGNQVFSISPETVVYDALVRLHEKNISALLVLENNKPIAIFTERDYARKVILKGKSSKETVIREIMDTELITIPPECSIEDAMRLMTTRFIRHLPVIENDDLIGVVSIGDVVKYLIEEQQFIISNMENYIKGS